MLYIIISLHTIIPYNENFLQGCNFCSNIKHEISITKNWCAWNKIILKIIARRARQRSVNTCCAVFDVYARLLCRVHELFCSTWLWWWPFQQNPKANDTIHKLRSGESSNSWTTPSKTVWQIQCLFLGLRAEIGRIANRIGTKSTAARFTQRLGKHVCKSTVQTRKGSRLYPLLSTYKKTTVSLQFI